MAQKHIHLPTPASSESQNKTTMFREIVFLSFISCAIALSLPSQIRFEDERAQACEYCRSNISCGDGLGCQDDTCERLSQEAPRCAASERCGPGKRRDCRTFRSGDKDELGELKKEKVDKGFFIGRTFRVRRCVNGLKKFRCSRMSSVCRHRFCITFTIRECEARGLFRGVVKESNKDSACCVFVLPPDCYAEQVCRCLTRYH